MERRFTDHEVRLEGEGEGRRIVGTAAVYYDGTPRTEFQLMPGMVERVDPKAFKRALREKQDVRGLFNHDPNHVLGRTASKTMLLESTDDGLTYRIQPGKTGVASDVTEHLDRGDVTGSSFSFAVRKDKWERTKADDGHVLEVRTLLDVDLFDVGPVTFPAYTATDAGFRSVAGVDEFRASYDAWRRTENAETEKVKRASVSRAVLSQAMLAADSA